jgi:hypothetical protein
MTPSDEELTAAVHIAAASESARNRGYFDLRDIYVALGYTLNAPFSRTKCMREVSPQKLRHIITACGYTRTGKARYQPAS